MVIKKAIILAAGFGKRLLPLTKEQPKPLLEVKGKKLLDYSISFLLANGVSDIIINSHYLHEQISNFVNERYPNIKISYEKEILDTGGGILNVLPFFQGENFLVLNSDTIWTNDYKIDLKKLTDVFYEGKNKAALLLATKENSFDSNLSGDFGIDEQGFLNKKAKNYIYTGCQILNPDIFNKKNAPSSFSINEIWEDLIKDNSLNGHVSSCTFLHATNLEIYNQLNSSKTIDL